MATTQDYIEFVCEQIHYHAAIRYKKMFGEYMVYVNNKPLLLVCDNTVFVKKHEVLDKLMLNAETGFPYNGAKEHYILDVENEELTAAVISALEPVTSLPKPKPKNRQKER